MKPALRGQPVERVSLEADAGRSDARGRNFTASRSKRRPPRPPADEEQVESCGGDKVLQQLRPFVSGQFFVLTAAAGMQGELVEC